MYYFTSIESQIRAVADICFMLQAEPHGTALHCTADALRCAALREAHRDVLHVAREPLVARLFVACCVLQVCFLRVACVFVACRVLFACLLRAACYYAQDYEGALAHYRMVAEDYKKDKAWKHFASTQATVALCVCVCSRVRVCDNPASAWLSYPAPTATPATTAPGLGSPLARLHQDWAAIPRKPRIPVSRRWPS